MSIVFYSSDSYTRQFFTEANAAFSFELKFLDLPLNQDTAVLAKGSSVVSCFIQDHLDGEVLKLLKDYGVQCIALRSAGYNHVDLETAKRLGLTVAYVPEYSPYAVAEHALALILSLDRKIHKAYVRGREGNFSLQGLLGFDLHGSTVGIVGTGKIGTAFARIMQGFDCRLLGYDVRQNDECKKYGVTYVELHDLFQQSDIISLHCPLLPATQYIINESSLNLMKNGVMLINTSRGGLIDTSAVIGALKSGKLGYLGLDVYEEEKNLFYKDLSNTIIPDDQFVRLQTFPNVLITSHQAFFTRQAFNNIANVTLQNIKSFLKGSGPIFRAGADAS